MTITKKNNRTRVLMLSVFVLALLLASCGGLGTDDESTRTLVVTGTGEAKGVPDMATIQLGVSVIDENIGVAIDEANSTMQRITDVMTSRGIREVDTQTTSYNVWRQDIHSPETGMPTGEATYHVDTSMAITVRDINDLGPTIDAGLEAGANNVMGISFEISDTSLLETEARSVAIANAKNRALEIAIGMDVELGQLLSVSDSGLVVPGPYASYGLKGDVVGGIGGGGAPASISPGQAVVSSQISAVYEILP